MGWTTINTTTSRYARVKIFPAHSMIQEHSELSDGAMWCPWYGYMAKYSSIDSLQCCSHLAGMGGLDHAE